MKIRLIAGMPFISAAIETKEQRLEFERVLIDTGSGACVFRTDDFEKIGIRHELEDKLNKMRGIGGYEYVIEKSVEKLEVGELSASPFTIQLGALDYGMQIDGIIGMDFLLKTGAKIDFEKLEING